MRRWNRGSLHTPPCALDARLVSHGLYVVVLQRVAVGAIAKWPGEVETEESGIPAQLVRGCEHELTMP